MATSPLEYTPQRRSTRIDKTIILTVRGMDAFQGRYVEKVPTLILSCHGCRYRSKHEPIRGNLVLLELNAERDFIDSAQARVRWLQEAIVGKERLWEVAVELEKPGNIWGVASPPEDWLSPLANNRIGRCESAQGFQIVARSQQLASVPDRVSAQAVLETVPAPLAPFVTGVSDYVQRLVSETVSVAVVKENARLIEDFRAQLEGEMTNTLERVIARCKEQSIRRAISELTEALESCARKTQERSIDEVAKSLKSTGERMTAQVTEISERINRMGDNAVERLKLTTEQFDREKLDEFRVRSVNLCEQAVEFLQQSMQRYTAQVEERSEELKSQFEGKLNERLTKAGCELDQKSRAVLDESQLALIKLSNVGQDALQGELKVLTTAALDQLANTLNQQATEISKQALNQLQVSTRRLLDSISGSIAEISTTTA